MSFLNLIEKAKMKKYILATALLASASVFADAPAHGPTDASAPTPAVTDTSTPASASAPAAGGFEGNYTCKGTEVGSDQPFTCDESIKKSGDTYAFTASCNDGTSYTGTGILDSNSNGLSIAFKNTKKSDEMGIAVKTLGQDGTMTGQWTGLDKTAIGQTSCTKKSS
jgi:hypothetical protein